MADSISTPRVTSVHLDNFLSRTVRIVGKVTQLRGETAVLDSDGAVTLQLNPEAHLTVGHAAEIIGKVNQNLSIRVLKATDVGPNVDFDAVRAVVEATHRHKELFYS